VHQSLELGARSLSSGREAYEYGLATPTTCWSVSLDAGRRTHEEKGMLAFSQPWFSDLYSSLKASSLSSLPTRCLDRKQAPPTLPFSERSGSGSTPACRTHREKNPPFGKGGRTAAPSTARRCENAHIPPRILRAFAGERIIHGRGRGGAGASTLVEDNRNLAYISSERISDWTPTSRTTRSILPPPPPDKPPPGASGAPL
jgi:hypothetical protein